MTRLYVLLAQSDDTPDYEPTVMGTFGSLKEAKQEQNRLAKTSSPDFWIITEVDLGDSANSWVKQDDSINWKKE